MPPLAHEQRCDLLPTLARPDRSRRCGRSAGAGVQGAGRAARVDGGGRVRRQRRQCLRRKPRPGYGRLLEALESGQVDAVLAWHVDRLHRSPKELEGYIDICEPRKVLTRTVRAGELDLATASGRMVARQLGAVARYESEQTAGRVRAGKADAASRGAWQGGQRVFGYESVPAHERVPGGSALRVVPEEADAVREAASRVLAGESLRSVARGLTKAGSTTAQGRPWTGSSLRKVLLSPDPPSRLG